MRYLLAVDGSEHATQATSFLRRVLRPCDFVVVYTAGKPGAVNGRLVEQALASFENLPEENKAGHIDTAKEAREGIVQVAKEKEVDVVVCGSRGVGMLRRNLLGSVSNSVLHESEKNVLVVHRGLPAEGTPKWMVCVDGSAHSKRAVHLLARLAANTDHILLWAALIPPTPYVAPPGQVALCNPQYDTQLKEFERAAATAIHDARAILEQEGFHHDRIVGKIELCTDPRDAALDFADANGAHCIVCGCRGMGTVARLVFGSFSSHLVQNAEKHAVLVVR